MLDFTDKGLNLKIFATTYDDELVSDILDMASRDYLKGCRIRIMPDCHVGKGCVIGTTIEVKDAIEADLVGVDIGCGMLLVPLPDKEIDLPILDKTIREKIPYGMGVRKERIADFPEFDFLKIKDQLKDKKDYILNSIGTLGGGNHFIEIDIDEEGHKYLLIHSGSRYLGLLANKIYNSIALKSEMMRRKSDINDRIKKLKEEGREKEIENILQTAGKNRNSNIPLRGEDFKDYVHDIRIIQCFASLNRKMIAHVILSSLGIDPSFLINYGELDDEHDGYIECIHNYLDTEDMILRKGAIRARKGEKLIIPISMRDGAILARGRGNPDYNYSCPHGAGRILSRKEAFQKISMDDYSKAMEGIYSTSVNRATIDESPFAYKSMKDIIDNIKDSCDIEKIIKPIYNFKAD